jgi:hypothetical protein
MGSQRPRPWQVAADLIRGAADQALDYADSAARSQAEALWERGFNDLHSHYERLADGLPSEFCGGHSTGGHHGDQIAGHPLSWYASFCPRSRHSARSYRPGPGMTEQDFVTGFIGEVFRNSQPGLPEVGVQVDFTHASGTLRYSSGVTRGGHIIAEGPAGVISAPRGVSGCYGRIKAALRDIGDFIDGTGPLISAQLREISADQPAS